MEMFFLSAVGMRRSIPALLISLHFCHHVPQVRMRYGAPAVVRLLRSLLPLTQLVSTARTEGDSIVIHEEGDNDDGKERVQLFPLGYSLSIFSDHQQGIRQNNT